MLIYQHSMGKSNISMVLLPDSRIKLFFFLLLGISGTVTTDVSLNACR